VPVHASSDGLYSDAAEPQASYEFASENISITSTVFVETLFGQHVDDVYEHTNIDFTIANSSEAGAFFLNGFTDQIPVYLQLQ